jgi:hypothetical protein
MIISTSMEQIRLLRSGEKGMIAETVSHLKD